MKVKVCIHIREEDNRNDVIQAIGLVLGFRDRSVFLRNPEDNKKSRKVMFIFFNRPRVPEIFCDQTQYEFHSLVRKFALDEIQQHTTKNTKIMVAYMYKHVFYLIYKLFKDGSLGI